MVRYVNQNSTGGNYVKPAISLKKDIFYIGGDGSEVYPYIIDANEIGYSIKISEDSKLKSLVSLAAEGRKVKLFSTIEGYGISSFKVNGKKYYGSTFVMPAEDVVISDAVLTEELVIESEHDPYPDNLREIKEHTFEGATSLTIELDYQTESTRDDYIYLYDNTGKEYGKYGGGTHRTETIMIPGDYIKILFRSDAYRNDYYGYKAIITPNYDGYSINIAEGNNVTPNYQYGFEGLEIKLNSTIEAYVVKSFKMNGQSVEGDTFKMPAEDISITDVILISGFESEHNPYSNSLNEYKEHTFEGATSLTIKLDYQTESTNYDYIYLYDSTGKQYGKYGGTTRKTETITIPGDYIKILFHTDGSENNYYGYKATITPNYD